MSALGLNAAMECEIPGPIAARSHLLFSARRQEIHDDSVHVPLAFLGAGVGPRPSTRPRLDHACAKLPER